jgi:hypothetical protein
LSGCSSAEPDSVPPSNYQDKKMTTGVKSPPMCPEAGDKQRMTVVPIRRLRASGSSRRGVSSRWSMDSLVWAGVSVIGAAPRSARQPQQASSVSGASPRPAAHPGGREHGERIRTAARKGRRIHEEMDRGAAARENNGRTTPRSVPNTTADRTAVHFREEVSTVRLRNSWIVACHSCTLSYVTNSARTTSARRVMDA